VARGWDGVDGQIGWEGWREGERLGDDGAT
jgi:hypothetical protein